MSSEVIVIKVGGRALRPEAIPGVADELAARSGAMQAVLVHGGGREVTRLSERLGITSLFEEGLRMTTTAEMEVVDMVLSGKMNKELVRALQAHGVPAVGISGSDGALFTGHPVKNKAGEETRTGTLDNVEPGIIHHLLSGGYVPVIASTFMSKEGAALNLNADDAALALAVALKAQRLLFLSDVEGVMNDGSVIDELLTSETEAYITAGTINGGMVPKIRSSVEAVQNAVETIIIGRYAEAGDLSRLLEGSAGTRIVHG